MGHEVFQQTVFLDGEFYHRIPSPCTAGVAIQHEVVAPKLPVRTFFSPPQQSLDTCFQFLETERFHQIVVRPGIQPLYNILGRTQRRQHDDRRMVPFLQTELPTNLKPVHLRHNDIQHKQIEHSFLQHRPCRASVMFHLYFMPELLQAPPDERSDVLFVFRQ